MIQKNSFLLLKMASIGLKALPGPLFNVHHESKDHVWQYESKYSPNFVLLVVQDLRGLGKETFDLRYLHKKKSQGMRLGVDFRAKCVLDDPH